MRSRMQVVWEGLRGNPDPYPDRLFVCAVGGCLERRKCRMSTLLLEPLPAAERRGGVWDYISPSRLNLWLRCPLAFRLQYIDGVRTPTTPAVACDVHRKFCD
jgi:hypothetical protein